MLDVAVVGRAHLGRRLRSRRAKSAGVLLALSAYAAFALGPVVWIFLMSIKRGRDIIAFPPVFVSFTPTWDNYAAILQEPNFLNPFKNTLIVTVGAVAVTLVFGLPTAYAIARMNFKRKEDIAFAFLSLRFAPELFVVLPLFVLYQSVGLYDSYVGLILAYQLVTFPLMVWMMRSFFEEVPREIEEAIFVDGGTRWTAFRMIATRLVVSGLAASAVLAFVFAWNTYALPLVLASRETQVITSAILGFMQFADIQWGRMAAGAIISVLPAFLFASVLLRKMIRGLTAGTVKG